jgi:hypothetical protein
MYDPIRTRRLHVILTSGSPMQVLLRCGSLGKLQGQPLTHLRVIRKITFASRHAAPTSRLAFCPQRKAVLQTRSESQMRPTVAISAA